MKQRLFFSSMMVTSFALLGGGSVDSDGSLSGWVWILLVVAVVAFIASGIYAEKEHKKETLRREKLLSEKREEREKQKQEFDAWYATYVAQNGTPDKTIVIRRNDKNNVIYAHEAKKLVYIQGNFYEFKSILGCTFSDAKKYIKGATEFVTDTNTGSMIGRSIVGDIIAGPAGAIVGGSTAKRTTQVRQENDKVYHDYTVFINIDSISNPILKIHTALDGFLTNEIVGLMNVIISRR